MTELIRLHYPIVNFKKPVQQVVAMGFFDGVHLGHQAVLARAKQEAEKRGVPLAVLTYDPHPIVAFQKLNQPLRYLTPLEQKVSIMSRLGVDKVYVMRFTSKLSKLKGQSFVDEVLMHLNPLTVVAGFDHLYGANGTNSDMSHLLVYAKERFGVITVPELDDLNQKISSSTIRKYLDNGNVDMVTKQLGHPHATTGTVVHGEARGRELGYPTANIQTPENEWLPGIGIYAVKIQINNQWYLGMASIGRNVTFGEARPITVEINILDFKEEIYGEAVQVEWYHYLRGEVKFNGVQSLINQLKLDAEDTHRYFNDK
ncbi:riboflavin biosynthesis protein [Leuconostoc litchii]|uniref:Riboflavin biosynthesis protein n=1 Tax=Leuconostoc litchii TaxID=1981069 RepID=A0A6P2CL63_9LACO|nr:riboflavin biosynthesis protein RibF [Leuconostoc litchii]TYC46735.1 riboflavin biosynthesis protein RibF [Leuconostoc litchii]GMA70616.1 riboflavin biosynthesis protein [Leuconostoc litchii]